LNELLIGRLLRALTLRRIGNIIKTYSSFFFSALLKKPRAWGIPPTLTIEPTNICNLHCPLCITGAGLMKRPPGKMTLATFKKLIDQIGNDIFFLLIYHQGEPYINKNFFNFINIAKQKNIYVTSSTNGHFFTDDNIRKTIACGLDSMIVSLDGVNQTSYAKYRVGGQLERVIQGVQRLVAERKKKKSRIPNIALQFLVMKHNESEIAEMKKLSRAIGADRLLVKNIEVHSIHEAEEWLPEQDKFRRYFFNGKKLVVKGADKKYCSRPWLSTLINWDGTVVPCCFDKNARYPLGNLNESQNFQDIWKSKAYDQFRQKLLDDRKSIDICRNCNQGFGSFLAKRFWKRTK
jgi:radical SAM protein with 4Fe4S-binding SPASM domain